MLRYDFDLYLLSDVVHQTASARLQAKMAGDDNQVRAVFHDPYTVEAVTSAPPVVRLFLEEAGFELGDPHAHSQSMPADRSDNDMRRTLAAQLTAALSNRAMKKALARASEGSEFDITDLIKAVVTGERTPAPVQDHPRSVTPRRPAQLQRRGLRSLA